MLKKLALLLILLSGCLLMLARSCSADLNNNADNNSKIVTFEFSEHGDGYALTNVECGSAVNSLTIPNEHNGLPVVHITNDALGYCRKVQSITIPASVKSMGSEAFVACNNLNTITVESGNTAYESIGNCIIEKSSNTLILGCGKSSIPSTVTIIGAHAFRGRESLYSINIPENITTIEYNAFRYCLNLTDVTIADSVTKIGDCAFLGCKNLKNLKLSNSLTTISSYAFSDCNSLTTLSLPPSVSVIDSAAFESCDGFTEIYFPETVHSIGGRAFANCKNLKRVFIPSSVGYVGKMAFQGCGDLSEIGCDAQRGRVNWSSAWSWACSANVYWDVTKEEFSKFPERLQYSGSSVSGIGTFSGQHLIIPEEINGYTITTITDYAFFGCHAITGATIPNTIKYIRACAFNDCENLETIAIPDSVIVLEERVFDKCDNLTDIYCEADSMPIGWSDDWLGDCDATVHWGA